MLETFQFTCVYNMLNVTCKSNIQLFFFRCTTAGNFFQKNVNLSFKVATFPTSTVSLTSGRFLKVYRSNYSSFSILCFIKTITIVNSSMSQPNNNNINRINSLVLYFYIHTHTCMRGNVYIVPSENI